jgi:hypothetical protein
MDATNFNIVIDSLGARIAHETMTAAATYLHRNGQADSVDLDALLAACKREGKAAADRILDQGKVLVETGRGGWLDALVKAECAAAGIAAAKAVAP